MSASHSFIFLKYLETCLCDSVGSMDSSYNDDGLCSCHTNYVGDKCDQCAEGFAEFPACDQCAYGYFGFPNCQGILV